MARSGHQKTVGEAAGYRSLGVASNPLDVVTRKKAVDRDHAKRSAADGPCRRVAGDRYVISKVVFVMLRPSG